MRRIAGAAALALAGALAASANAQAPQEPGVTLRTYQLGTTPNELCTIKAGTTPNVDKVMPAINWSTTDQFGASNNFQSHVYANLRIETAGEHTFRLTSDDGSRLKINGSVVIDHDLTHGADPPKEGAVTLTAGTHKLDIDYFDRGNDNILKLEWRRPGQSAFEVVPTAVLSTDSDVVRVVAPGNKYCEGAADTPGDGLRLESVNPNYTLTNLRPEGFEPRVAAMDFRPDGKLALLTSGTPRPGADPTVQPGEVFIVSGVTGETGPDKVTYTKVATGLDVPMGIAAIGDKLYVTEKHRLTELSADTNGDGLMEHKSLVTLPNGGNFHEFNFGLLYDEDFFYVNRSVAINQGGATTSPQPGANPGTHLKIDRKTYEVTLVAGGLRTPNGTVRGPEDQLFVMDNQGGWLPASKLVHIKPDRFFNHFTTPAGPFDHKPVTKPVLWLPQNEIANSPSTPIMLSDGPFKGQLVFGDVTYGGLQRAFLEKVDGEYQGAVFRHSAGLEAGVNRVITGPDGALYIGGIGSTGNWAEPGKLKHGLQKLTPNGTNVFDMEKLEVVEGGFRISYTQPLSDATVAKLKTAYTVMHWRYGPTAAYGGPKLDEEKLIVTDAVASEDRKTVTLKIAGLRPDHVVHIRSPRPFAAANGQELWNTEAWYTLNSLPGYETLAERGFYEAEESALLGAMQIDTEHSGYSGSGFADNFASDGAGVRFEVEVDEAGTHPVHVRYANGPSPGVPVNKKASLYVNNVKVETLTFPGGPDWKTWLNLTRNLPLVKGVNLITIKRDAGDDGRVNLDALKVGGGVDHCAPATLEPGYVALFDGTLASLDKWRMAGPGSFGRQEDCSMRGVGGSGLNWFTAQEFGSYTLKLDWKLVKDDNSGIFVGFPNPGNDRTIAINQGYEIQIDESDVPDRLTGSIYTFKGADRAAVAGALKPWGQWNAYEIRVQGQNIKVLLNGVLVNDFTSTEPIRDLTQGFIGVQNHGAGELIWYRNVRLKSGPVDSTPPTVAATVDGPSAGPVTVTLTGEDESPGAVALEYRLDGGGWTPYTAPVTVSAVGAHTVEYRATDATGNVSAVGSKSFTITQVVKTDTEHDIVGSVAPALAVTLGAPSPLGEFLPGVQREYTASLLAKVTSTAEAATLTVADTNTANTGKLVNGTHVLAQPLHVRSGTAAFAPLTAPVTLRALDAPVSGEDVPVEFQQAIGERDPLRTGRYSKTLTFTLSTTTP
ncbi:family 16 glycoside hydrolase [Solirubrobacter deserti]|uniref:DUF1080 domain-containing protein n=1 Tax=Solirubrobacter deserti TaxID=2282478 RepID=A0ABT4RCU9_9ACTN|nr:family 16 glycoside hydrolase [Solirubrobacter deserti]MDA0136353.1 DUF1080 domain-containing protein [Solirubrobacter deserti]